tara:strand:- start:187 stop:339 length:153 start_codon:yes stop_codon:yes gene_type:complete
METKVPTIVMRATGCQRADPDPDAKSNGTIPSIVVVQVIKIGRTRDEADS